MRWYLADLHIHTALSPCADQEMTPPAIVRAARDKGLDMIAVCDHNSAGNAAAVQACAAAHVRVGAAPTVVAGLEIATTEEVHVLGLFPDAPAAMRAGDEVRATLPDTGNGETHFGEQLLMDADGNVVAMEVKMLSSASGFPLTAAVDLIKRHGGLAVASHVDRPSFSVTSQLGMIPEDARFDALEISAAGVTSDRARPFKGSGIPLVTSSDSHSLAEIGVSCTLLKMAAPTFGELALALRGTAGRGCRFA